MKVIHHVATNCAVTRHGATRRVATRCVINYILIIALNLASPTFCEVSKMGDVSSFKRTINSVRASIGFFYDDTVASIVPEQRQLFNAISNKAEYKNQDFKFIEVDFREDALANLKAQKELLSGFPPGFIYAGFCGAEFFKAIKGQVTEDKLKAFIKDIEAECAEADAGNGNNSKIESEPSPYFLGDVIIINPKWRRRRRNSPRPASRPKLDPNIRHIHPRNLGVKLAGKK